MNTKTIPKPVLDILAAGPWRDDDYSINKFSKLLASHAEQDAMYGCTCQVLDGGINGFSPSESDSLIKHGLVPDGFYRINDRGGAFFNQHYIFSLEQFFAVCTKEWGAHVERTNALIGTPAGKILI